MLPFLFILIVTGLCVYISPSVVQGGTWMDYYWGGVIGILASGIILQIINKIRHRKEINKK